MKFCRSFLGILGLTALPLSAAAQEGTKEEPRIAISVSTTYWNFGKVAEVPDASEFPDDQIYQVQFGTMGNDIAYSVNIAGRLAKRLYLDGEIILAPTTLFVFPVENVEGEWSRWNSRPKHPVRMDQFTWGCFTLAARYKPLAFIDGSAGAGFCNLSGATYNWGAMPMHSWTTRFDLRVMPQINEHSRAGLKCGAHPTYLDRHKWTVVRQAVFNNDNIPGMVDGDKAKVEGHWALPVNCGLSFEVMF